jgi:hypothetical protein
MTDRAFWEIIYRSIIAIAAAIKKRYLSIDKHS